MNNLKKGTLVVMGIFTSFLGWYISETQACSNMGCIMPWIWPIGPIPAFNFSPICGTTKNTCEFLWGDAGAFSETSTAYNWTCTTKKWCLEAGGCKIDKVKNCSIAKPTPVTIIRADCGTTKNSCASGSFYRTNASSATHDWWECSADSGRDIVSCSSPRVVVPSAINGSCGTSTNSCISWNFLDTGDSSTQYRWSCNGSNGWSNATCSRAKPIAITTPSAVNGSCGSSTNTCTSGNIIDTTDSSTQYRWNCSGSNGWSTATCSNNKPVAPVIPTVTPPTGKQSPYNFVYRVKRCNDEAMTSCDADVVFNSPLLSLSHSNLNFLLSQDGIYRITATANTATETDTKTYIYKIDKTAPDAPGFNSSTHSNNTWSNNNDPQVTVVPQNAGPSPETNYYCLDTTNSCDPTTQGTTRDFSNLPDGTHYFRAKTCDIGGCSDTGVFIIKIDTTPPNINELPLNLSGGEYFKATDAKTLWFISDTVGAPIADIDTLLERFNDKNSSISVNFNTANNLTTSNNFSIVDSDIVPGRNYREYTLRVTRACDSVGNCANVNKVYVFKVYANNIFPTFLGNDIDTWAITSTHIADGSTTTIDLVVFDRYGNKILPVRKADNSILRRISTKVQFNNDSYLDQYNLSGTQESGVYIKWENESQYRQTSVGNSVTHEIFTQAMSADNDYSIHIKWYSPTQVAYDKAYGNFEFLSMSIATLDEGVENVYNIPNSAGNLRLRPLYQTDIGWDVADKIIEWSRQNASVTVTKNSSRTTSQNKLDLEFWNVVGWLNQSSSNLDMSVFTPTNYNIGEGQWAKTTVYNTLNPQIHILETLLSQISGVLQETQNTYFSSHMDYRIVGPNGSNLHVLYNGDILWKTAYHGVTDGDNTLQQGLKVLWITNTENGQDILVDQNKDNVQNIFGQITKSTLKKDMRQRVYGIIKNLPDTTGNDVDDLSNFANNSDGTKLLENSVLYFGDMRSARVDVTATNLSGNKSLVVMWGDIYIRNNIVANNTQTDILWIIALKNQNGQGWKIYIDPSVTRIDAIIYADKSLISYNGTSELDGNATQSELKNQLYILGSVFSENTVWGSHTTPLDCPYYITSTCTKIEAKKYDLNYLRRYFVNQTQDGGLVGWVNYFGNYDGTTYNYYNFPIVIEYNPGVQSTPPPLFK